MRTRQGLEDTLTGILCTKKGENPRDIASYIIDYFVEEENLIIPHNDSLSGTLIDFETYLKTVKNPDDNEHIYAFLVKQSKKE